MLTKYIIEHSKKDVLQYYTPGHKCGRMLHPSFRSAYGQQPFVFDLGFMGQFDDFHAPSGMLAEAERAASRLYKSRQSFFLINGSTSGLIALLLSTLHPGDAIILPRNVHRSIMSAMILGDFVPNFVDNDIEPATNLALPLNINCVERRQWDSAAAILVTSPTYHGIASDLRALTSKAEQHKIHFFVDEAHGAHLPFDDRLPTPALQSGAHAAVQSTHKTLQAITPGAMLHISDNGLDTARIRQALGMTQTSSANYAVLASLDASRALMEGEGRARLGAAIDAVAEIREEINSTGLMCAFSPERRLPSGFKGIDQTKLTVDFRALGLAGHEAAQLLFEEELVGAELSTTSSVLFFVTAADTADDLRELACRLTRFAKRHAGKRVPIQVEISAPPRIAGPLATTPREAFFRPSTVVPWENAAGHIAAEAIVPYPPGIPSLWPGERLQGDLDGFRRWLRRTDASVQASDPTLQSIKVAC